MPLPATWHPLPDVGATRGQGPRAAAYAHQKVGGVLWCRQSGQRQIRALHVREVRCSDVRDLSEKAAAPSLARQTHGGRTGQRQIPPCHPIGAFAQEVPQGTGIALLAAIQPAVGSDRASLEVGTPHGHTQPILCHSWRGAHRDRPLLRSLAKTKSGVA